MGTNYYRIPTEAELEKRKAALSEKITALDISPRSVASRFSIPDSDRLENHTPWDEFVEETFIHLGKRSGGWKFCWNFHNNKYFSNKKTLVKFVKSGRIVDEYGNEWSADEFLEMAFNWCPEGWDTQSYYADRPQDRVHWIDYESYADRYVDGLRVSSSTSFS